MTACRPRQAALLCALVLAAAAVRGAEPTHAELHALPDWTRAQLQAPGFAQRYRLDAYLNPFCLHGDFDGDGRGDLAVFVRDLARQRVGIAFLHRAGAAPQVVGAGHELGNGGDDFAWMDAWRLEEGAPPPAGGDAAARRGDAVAILRTESGGALLWWDGRAYRWQQQGD